MTVVVARLRRLVACLGSWCAAMSRFEMNFFQRLWASPLSRRRLVLGFYALLLLAVTVGVVFVVSTVMSSSGSFSDRLTESGDWLAGGTLVLAAIAGLVALQAYASATGLPDLKLSLVIEGPRIPDPDIPDEKPYPLTQVNGPFAFHIMLKNDSSYSARNPALVMRLLDGCYLCKGIRPIPDGWTIIDGDASYIFAVQWDGGPVYSIHGHSVRKLRLDVLYLMLQLPERRVKFELLAEGYRREVQTKLGVSWLPANWI